MEKQGEQFSLKRRNVLSTIGNEKTRRFFFPYQGEVFFKFSFRKNLPYRQEKFIFFTIGKKNEILEDFFSEGMKKKHTKTGKEFGIE